MKLNLRQGTRADAAAIARLSAQLGYPASEEETAARIAALDDREEHALLVAEDGGAVRGWIHVFEARRIESEASAEIGGLVVDAEHRRLGVGRALVGAALSWARARGLTRLRVRSREERFDARRFYEQLGFRVSKTQAVLDRPAGK